MLGPVTVGERRGWQIRAAAALLDLLKAAHAADVSPIVWTVNVHAGLLGQCETRGLFDLWARFVGPVQRWPEHTYGGRTHLHAQRDGWGQRNVRVTLIADVSDGSDETGTSASR